MATKTRTALIQNEKVIYGSAVWPILQRWAVRFAVCQTEPSEELKGSKKIIAFFEELKAHGYKGTLLIFKERAAAGRKGNSGFQAQVIKELFARYKNGPEEEQSFVNPQPAIAPQTTPGTFEDLITQVDATYVQRYIHTLADNLRPTTGGNGALDDN